MEKLLATTTSGIIEELYGQEFPAAKVTIQETRPDVRGDYTIVVFPFTRFSRKKPEETAHDIGTKVLEKLEEVKDYEVIKGFLNIEFSEAFWINFLKREAQKPSFGIAPAKENESPVVIEFSSPNTNKPLHLGHIRNNLVGDAISRIIEASGHTVKKVNLVNDRGIHICKSMLAWQKWGGGETPEQAAVKGDHLAGKYYVLFDREYKKEVEQLKGQGVPSEQAKKEAPLLLEAQEMLRRWEQSDKEVVALWNKMNRWVYDGFDITYERMGIAFDKVYHESETYLLGKDIVLEGLQKEVLFKKEDGSVWADLSEEGLDEKLLLRADGTSVYMTQDLGTAALRYRHFAPREMIYVVGNEQIYHFDVLKRVLKKLGFPWHNKVTHLLYGMVELPEGKMKSREGTVVDADNLMDEMVEAARITTTELGKIEGLTQQQADELFGMIGMGALKYFILKVDPKKTMTFNPKESIDLNGNTGPFIQYTHARIQSVLRKARETGAPTGFATAPELHDREKILIKRFYDFPSVVAQAAEGYNPALLANYTFDLVKEYNQFYHDVSILKAEEADMVAFRLMLSEVTASLIRRAMGLLGIRVPDKM
jgi:arginyl-tRNA synthetase